MVAIIIISVIVLMGAAFSFYFWQRTPSKTASGSDLAPGQTRGLFDLSHTVELIGLGDVEASRKRAELVHRAEAGDLETLSQALSEADSGVYISVLDALVEWASQRQENFAALVSHISNSKVLRANKRLAERLIDKWTTEPDRRSTTELLHIAALSDDAGTYQQAVELVLSFWQLGRLARFSAEELVELFESQYWILAAEVRRGGAGFALKRKLAGIRRELATATPAR
ncbi:MAG: hypothetical protein WAV20_00785 [Blastocatellia bacterium]